mmetsp:Transcript_41717/g.63733  ORF Transcript_41717/g.63733 Transcript_41717/m.63733 type:complete len:109 (+) Transcript_41717:716-1042(+)
MLMIASSQITAIYLSWAKPFESAGLGRMELFNELTIVVASCSLSLFSDYVPSANKQYHLGWGLIFFLSVNMIINILYVLSLSSRSLFLSCRRRYARWQRTKELRISTN